MNDDLRRSLDRAAGDDPQIDMTESAWLGGRVARRRRHTAQTLGGLAAVSVLAGALAVGGGVLTDPDAYVGPAVPTVDDVASTTGTAVQSEAPPTDAVDTAPTRTEDPADSSPPRTETETEPADPSGGAGTAAATPGDGILVLSPDAVEGRPLDGPVEDVVAAVTAELGEPQVLLGVVASDCAAERPYGDLYSWEVLEITVTDAGVRWGLDSWRELPVAVDLPGSLEMGQTAADVRSLEQVADETTDLAGATVLQLTNGVAVFVGSDGVFRVVNAFVGIC